MYRLLVIICCGMLLISCASAPYQGGSTNTSVKMASAQVSLNNTSKVKQLLYQQHNDWHQVPHRMGGLSKSGIDCSGLVYKTYRSKFGIDVPRSTEYQSQAGQTIQQEHLTAGDLVFFKTGYKLRHVGIYIEKGKFLHVSSSNGVMISSMDNPYWSSSYWKAQRLQ